jgi:hypothetical protein
METEKPAEMKAVMSWLGKQPRRKFTARACLICDTTFATRGRGRYCSAACRSKAYRHRLVAAEATRLGLSAPAGEGNE